MYCLQHFLPLFLLPFPHQNSFFLLSYVLSLIVHHRPCPYCSLVLVALFASTCALWSSAVEDGFWPADLIRVVALGAVGAQWAGGSGSGRMPTVQWDGEAQGSTGVAVKIERVLDGAQVYADWDLAVVGADGAQVKVKVVEGRGEAATDVSEPAQTDRGKEEAGRGRKDGSDPAVSGAAAVPEVRADEHPASLPDSTTTTTTTNSSSQPISNSSDPSASQSQPSSTTSSTSPSPLTLFTALLDTTSLAPPIPQGSRCYVDLPRPATHPLKFFKSLVWGAEAEDARFVWWWEARPRNVVYVGRCGGAARVEAE
ncbi:hypothetical protein M427DRAFT_34304 [Gonapodya prolifera JEL478]|uniref:Uncharacterized protein n=1 Tax=Gonapodya prolifera (strain JEL478) TaxID=1344416 RepID=A0A139A8L7_GONPJ|nr:hypothetical protein M427DRAFT_34304 [Gonapodya prolifera JEL478]|eukprot:KXS13077.1 hypothetical protein M427DRAFT_34304 [Gonapodya prolifera JEL478]